MPSGYPNGYAQDKDLGFKNCEKTHSPNRFLIDTKVIQKYLAIVSTWSHYKLLCVF